jgi:hypothetical protein
MPSVDWEMKEVKSVNNLEIEDATLEEELVKDSDDDDDVNR